MLDFHIYNALVVCFFFCKSNLFLPYYGIVWLNIFLAFKFTGEQVSVFLKS